jgi:hypothetical protein
MNAFQDEFPDVVIFLTFGHSLPYVQTGGKREKLPEAEYGLLAPFLDGLFEAAGPNVMIVDGHELSYSYRDVAKFPAAYKRMAEEVPAAVVADPKKYNALSSFAFGLWMDYDWRKKGWDTDDPSKNYFTPESFAAALKTALDTSDEYVWIYTETPRWWSAEGKSVKLPDAYVDAVRKARQN